MPINSFGYQVMSLGEIHAALSDVVENLPELRDKPVWIDYRGAGVFMPVKTTQIRFNGKDGPRFFVLGEAG
jgi:hypothetical protein